VDYFASRLRATTPSESGEGCGECDACLLRLKGFAENNIPDPAPYRRSGVAV
jgi:7-cyano-7-deazaguanine synthase in queuosine biosynthesis